MPSKRSNELLTHAQVWLPRDLVSHVIEYERSWEGIFKSEKDAPNLTLVLPIDENRLLVQNSASKKLAVFDLTTGLHNDFVSGEDVRALGRKEFIFRDPENPILTTVNFSKNEAHMSMRELKTRSHGIYVLDGEDNKIVLAYASDDGNEGVCLFDHRDPGGLIKCKFVGYGLCPLQPLHFAVLPTSFHRKIHCDVIVLKVKNDLSGFDFVTSLPISSQIHVDYQVIYNKLLSCVLVIDQNGQICVYDFTNFPSLPPPTIWYVTLSKNGATLSQEKPKQVTFPS
jgi:hypothetical protein